LADATGVQRLLVNRDGVQLKPVDVSSTPAFRVVNFLGGEDYISPVTFDAQHQGQATLAVPLVQFTTTQAGANLSTSQPGVILPQSAIKGALVISLNLQSLWNSVLNHKLGQSGYAYVADDQGSLIAYPNPNFLVQHANASSVTEVRDALAETQLAGSTPPAPRPRITTSETGQRVLSSHTKIGRTGWVVVAEEPIASVYAPVTNDALVALAFFAISVFIGLGLILLLARSLLAPIAALEEGARHLASGDLKYRVSLKRRDEYSLLADTLNQMADKISADFAKLHEVDRLKNEFIAIASHNLRTPLTVMKGYIEMLKSDAHSEVSKQVVAAIEHSTRELAGFSEDLLTISSIEAGYANLAIRSITVGELLDPLQSDLEAMAKQKNITLNWTTPEPGSPLTLSPMHIRSVISNLVTNALEFTPDSGVVDFNFGVLGGNYVITVKDTGTGIPPEEMERLFTKFHRATGTLQYDHPGTGIGLYVTLLIVEAHKGHVKVSSQVGRGSTFTVVLPAGA
jgi:signal transduction histidine kinase